MGGKGLCAIFAEIVSCIVNLLTPIVSYIVNQIAKSIAFLRINVRIEE